LSKFGNITSPDVPVLFHVIDFAIRGLLIFSVYYIVKRIPNPIKICFVLLWLRLKRSIQRLKVRYDAYKARQWKHRHKGFWLIIDLFGKKHEWRRNEMLGDKNIMRLFRL
jgi:hypothetical protein